MKIIFILGLCWPFRLQAATLHLKVDDLRSDRGQVLVGIFKDADSFPRHPEKALVKLSLPPKVGSIEIDVPDLPEGTYAVALHHDEDGNNRMGFNWVGIPKEGFGFSGNRRVYFGPPSFEKASIHVDHANTDCAVKMKYF